MEDALIKRILPHSTEAEQSVIGSMLMDKEAVLAASEIITKDDFYERQYGVMFEAMVELYQEGKPVDLVTVQDRLRQKDIPEEVGSPEFVLGLMNAVSTSANISGEPSAKNLAEVSREIIDGVDFVVNPRFEGKPTGKPSSIIAFGERNEIKILRE